MSIPDSERQALLARIDQLLAEAYVLPRTPESWERRLYIDWELFLLFRRLAAGEDKPLADDDPQPFDAHPRRPRRHDRPSRLSSWRHA